ncbi:helix-turn-helix domain-containing protein [Paenibacillus sp. SGZ-1009]|uniref:helix-turn-helix domain-containing protein n=1 Tax=Paenibacillus campi TaxID=3106031 RepID=UPI002AFFCBB5|nr:helix-turn-helix domain-containing protein [Paenibacillus sp. SGZ-1009]
MNKKYRVELQEQERQHIQQLLHRKGTAQGIRNRGLILLWMDESQGIVPKQAEVAQRIGVSEVTVYSTVKQYSTSGLEATLTYRKRERPGHPAILTGEQEARIIALACSEPPEGYARWTVRLLTHRTIELRIVDQIGRETIRTCLKKHNFDLT